MLIDERRTTFNQEHREPGTKAIVDQQSQALLELRSGVQPIAFALSYMIVGMTFPGAIATGLGGSSSLRTVLLQANLLFALVGVVLGVSMAASALRDLSSRMTSRGFGYASGATVVVSDLAWGGHFDLLSAIVSILTM